MHESLQALCDSIDNETDANEILQPEKKNSSNILNEPVSPHDYQLVHRKSIHEYFSNPEMQQLSSKQSSADEVKAMGMSPGKGKATMMGTVSEAFRKRNKFTQD